MTEIRNVLLTGDCLIESDKIASGSVGLILTDLPYGTVKGIGVGSGLDHGMIGKTEWDEAIDPARVYEIANRILRKNGKMVLFSQEPYTSRLINEAVPNLPFAYRMIWEKDHFANALVAKKAPVSYFEDVVVFSKPNNKLDYKKTNPLREVMAKYVTKYGKELLVELFLKEGRYSTEMSARVHASYKFGYNKGTRIDLMSEDLYTYLSDSIHFEESYRELKEIHSTHHERLKRELNDEYPSVFNLWEGGKYKSNILRYKKDYDGFHPTQKPVLLLEDLIKTFSNEGDVVVDLTAGSGSTAVAAINAGRNFIAIEQDADYAAIAQRRIEEAQAVKDGEAVE